MLDWQLSGANPGGHHLTSLICHVVNVLLLFWVLARLTRRLWPPALVAALFALHPLHVESVAWAAERKDVLSACFWLLTLWAYLRYVERPGAWRYLALTGSFILGLLAKPMLVTEPFVLLLLDYWPLGRWPLAPAPAGKAGRKKPGPPPGPWSGVWPLVREKLPLFFLSAACSLITVTVQQEAGSAIPAAVRLSNALWAYVSYLYQMLWPLRLAVFYPHPGDSLSWWQVTGAGLILAAITAAVLRWGRRFPYLPVGWFWYLGTLVPVIGLVQVGRQAMADRYTYIPLIGIFLILAFGAADLAAGRRRRQAALSAAFGLALLACLILTRTQVGYWRNSESLFTHAAAVTADNYLAYNNLGLAYLEEGRVESAREMFRRTIRINPEYSDAAYAYNNLGIDLAAKGEIEAAIGMFQEALRLRPNLDQTYHNLGLAYLRQGRIGAAREMFATALKHNPGNLEAREMLQALPDR